MPRLFKVEFITKDTRLGASLVALEGIALGRPEVTPIRGAELKGNKVRGTGSIRDAVAKYLARRKGSEVSRAEIRDLIEQNGGNPSSTSALIDHFKKKGSLKGKGTGHDGYKVT